MSRPPHRYGDAAAYVLITVIAVVGFWTLETQQRQLDTTQVDLCGHAYDNRQAIRDLTTSIAELGQRLTTGDGGPGAKPTAEQRRTLREFRAFEDAQLERLDLPVCPNREDAP